MQFPTVSTSPKPYGVQVEWQWPEGSDEHSRLEMQYINGDGQLNKQTIAWPLAGAFIGGLKAGERLQIRLRPIDKNGVGRDWTNGDWIGGVSSSNAGDYFGAITCGSDTRLMTTFSTPQFKNIGAEVLITDAFIKNSIQAAKLSPSQTISSLVKSREKVRSIAARYMSGAASKFIDDMVDDLMNLAYPSCSEDSSPPAPGIDINIEAILKKTLENIAAEAARQAEATEKAMAELSEIVRKAIQKECKPGGQLWYQGKR